MDERQLNLLLNVDPPSEDYMLRNIIRTKFQNGMHEIQIGAIMTSVLQGLAYMHDSWQFGHNNVDSTQIYVYLPSHDTSASPIRLVFDPMKDIASTPEGIWGLGIAALEMAYGYLPRSCKSREQLVSMAKNLMRIVKQRLSSSSPDDQELEKEEEAMYNQEKEELLDTPCSSTGGNAKQRGKEKVVKTEVDDPEEQEEFKARHKGKKGELKIADDDPPEEIAETFEKIDLGTHDDELKEKEEEKEMGGKEKKGKEKLDDICDQIWEQLFLLMMQKYNGMKNEMIKVPELDMVVDNVGIENKGIEITEEKKNPKQSQKKKKKKKKKNKSKSKRQEKPEEEENKADQNEREFSRNLLEVLMMCLDQETLYTANEILKHPFFDELFDWRKLRRKVKLMEFEIYASSIPPPHQCHS